MKRKKYNRPAANAIAVAAVYQLWPVKIKKWLSARAQKDKTDLTALTLAALLQAYPELEKFANVE